jgi:hypothetical protein
METALHVGEASTYSLKQAKLVIAGYAFGTRPFRFRPGAQSYGPAPQVNDYSTWAYRAYDCVPADPSPALTQQDLLVVAAINVHFDSDTMLSLQVVSEDVSEALARIPADIRFWELDRESLGREANPGKDSHEWSLLRAWWLLRGAPNVGVAIAHKVLHHKRPLLAPVLDEATISLLGHDQWVRIHEDLTEQEEEWSSLEGWFSALSTEHDGVPLYRLRLHDILLWSDAAGWRDVAAGAGEDFLKGAGRLE